MQKKKKKTLVVQWMQLCMQPLLPSQFYCKPNKDRLETRAIAV